jgi:hypothetical protein
MSQARSNASDLTLLSQEQQRDGAMNCKSIEEITERIAEIDIAVLSTHTDCESFDRKASAGLICAKLVSAHGWLGFVEGIVQRREFIALLGSAAAIRPLGAHAERLDAR